MNFTLIAHRGFSSRAPENTLPAFDLAIESGFPNIELDAQLTSDGQVVVIHDDTVDRTTDGAGAVASLTLAQLRELDAGARFRPRVGYGPARPTCEPAPTENPLPGASAAESQLAANSMPGPESASPVRVPTLEELLVRYRGRAHIHLELKSREVDLAQAVAALLGQCGWLLPAVNGASPGDPFGVPGLTITSFDLDHLVRSRTLLPGVRHGWLVGAIDDFTLERARTAGLDGLYPRARLATPESVGRARSSGFVVRGWGVADESDLSRLVESGAQGTTVDWPDRARRLLDSFGRQSELVE